MRVPVIDRASGNAVSAKDLPPEAPLAMPVQDFHRYPPLTHQLTTRWLWRRGFLIAGSGLIGFAASIGIAALLAVDGYDAIDQVLALLSLMLFSWIAFGLLNASAGLIVSIRDRHRPDPPRRPARPRRSGIGNTRSTR